MSNNSRHRHPKWIDPMVNRRFFWGVMKWLSCAALRFLYLYILIPEHTWALNRNKVQILDGSVSTALQSLTHDSFIFEWNTESSVVETRMIFDILCSLFDCIGTVHIYVLRAEIVQSTIGKYLSKTIHIFRENQLIALKQFKCRTFNSVRFLQRTS